MKHNEHVLLWLKSLRDEAVSPECTMARMIEITRAISKYSLVV